MERLNNPFVIYGYKGADYFCDRKKETAAIIRALSNERNIVLISPRRIGKTGLIHHAFEAISDDEPCSKCFYMDISSTRNLNQFIQMLAKTVIGKVNTPSQSALRKISSLFASYKPVLTVDELSGMPTFSLTVSNEQREESLQHIFEYLKSSDKRIYIAIDEFQQIAEYAEKGTEALLRSHIQFLPNVYFIFAGSRQHIMADMFLSAKRPFYQSSQIINLPLIDKREYFNFANRLMHSGNLSISEEDFNYIYDHMDGQTWYVQDILNRLYETRGEFGTDVINATINDLVNEQEVAYINYLDSLTSNQVALLTAIAKDRKVKSVLAHDFITKHQLPSQSSVSTAMKALLNREFVYRHNGDFIIYDRFFGLWLANKC